MIHNKVQAPCPGCSQPIVVTERDGKPVSECGGVDEGLCAEAGYAFDEVYNPNDVRHVWDADGTPPDHDTCMKIVMAHRDAMTSATLPQWAVDGSKRLRDAARAEADRLTEAPLVAMSEEIVGGNAVDMAEVAEVSFEEDAVTPEESRAMTLQAATARLVRVAGMPIGDKAVPVATIVVVVEDASSPKVIVAAALDVIVTDMIRKVNKDART